MEKSYKRLTKSFIFIISLTFFSATSAQTPSVAQNHDELKSVVVRFFHNNPGPDASYFQQLSSLYTACEGNFLLMGKFIMTYLRA